MEEEKRQSDNSLKLIIWASFVLSALALFMSIVAFNRSGVDIDRVVERSLYSYQDNLKEFYNRMEVRAKLIALRTRIETAEAGEEIAEEVASTRRGINLIYENSTDELEEERRELVRELDQIEEATRLNTADALEDLELLINSIETDIRTDEN